jgi:hypothetical protein
MAGTGHNRIKDHSIIHSVAADEYINRVLKNMRSPLKIKWLRLPGLKLQAYVDDIGPRGFGNSGLKETDMDPIQAWSVECNCGTRMSFNVWKFKSEKQITMFLIRWTE